MNLWVCWLVLVSIAYIRAGKLLLAEPLGGPGAADILTAKHFGVEVEGSAFLLPGALSRGVWLPARCLRGASPFLPSFQDSSVGCAAAPLSAQRGTGEARLSLLPLHCLEYTGSGKSSCFLCRQAMGSCLANCSWSCCLQTDLIILGRKTELDTLKRGD